METIDHILLVNKILEKHFNEKPLKIERMVTGICNEVYIAEYPDRKVVVRMNTEARKLLGTEKNINLFKSLGIKVSNILASDYTKTDIPFAYQVLTYLEGKDLGQVIEFMTDDELRDFARETANIFKKLSTIPTNGKFGWVGADENSTIDSWAKIIKADKIEERNKKTEVVGDDLVKKEKELYQKYLSYFNSVKSTMYFDDMSSKNILVHDGKFAGLIDLDDLMYGDPLETVGAIKTSWYGTHYGEVYANAVQDELNLSIEQRKMVTVYAILNRILWLSEKGIKFNENTSTEIDWEKVEKDKEVINGLLNELESFDGAQLPSK